MKTIHLSQPNLQFFFKGKTDNARTQKNVSPAFENNAEQGTDTNHKPSTTEYIISVLGEGLKQNFLGADINMEFLTLTVRSLASTSIKAIQQVIKPGNAKQRSQADNRQFNQTSF
jgi:translation initiation factor 2 alpha subunit (eIF-2alpha)